MACSGAAKELRDRSSMSFRNPNVLGLSILGQVLLNLGDADEVFIKYACRKASLIEPLSVSGLKYNVVTFAKWVERVFGRVQNNRRCKQIPVP